MSSRRKNTVQTNIGSFFVNPDSVTTDKSQKTSDVASVPTQQTDASKHELQQKVASGGKENSSANLQTPSSGVSKPPIVTVTDVKSKKSPDPKKPSIGGTISTSSKLKKPSIGGTISTSSELKKKSIGGTISSSKLKKPSSGSTSSSSKLKKPSIGGTISTSSKLKKPSIGGTISTSSKLKKPSSGSTSSSSKPKKKTVDKTPTLVVIDPNTDVKGFKNQVVEFLKTHFFGSNVIDQNVYTVTYKERAVSGYSLRVKYNTGGMQNIDINDRVYNKMEMAGFFDKFNIATVNCYGNELDDHLAMNAAVQSTEKTA